MQENIILKIAKKRSGEEMNKEKCNNCKYHRVVANFGDGKKVIACGNRKNKTVWIDLLESCVLIDEKQKGQEK